VPTSAFCSPIVDHSDCRALDVRHGRVLLYHQELGMEGVLVVRDPITHEQRRIPMPNLGLNRSTWKAAVVCATTADADAGSCDHFDCHRGSFLVVLVASYIPDIRIWTYSSDAGSWSDPVEYQRHGSYVDYSVPITLVGSTIFFGFWSNKIALKYDLESTKRSIDVVELPLLPFRQLVVLRTTEDGRLGLATVHESKLYMWSMEPEADGGWTCNRVIELEMLLRRNAILTEPDLVGFVERIGVIFLKADDVLFRVDLNTEKVENVYQRRGIYTVVPYMSFCTPGTTFLFLFIFFNNFQNE